MTYPGLFALHSNDPADSSTTDPHGDAPSSEEEDEADDEQAQQPRQQPALLGGGGGLRSTPPGGDAGQKWGAVQDQVFAYLKSAGEY